MARSAPNALEADIADAIINAMRRVDASGTQMTLVLKQSGNLTLRFGHPLIWDDNCYGREFVSQSDDPKQVARKLLKSVPAGFR